MAFLVYFQKNNNHDFIEKGNSWQKVVAVEEELDGIDIDDIGNLDDSPRLVFIDEDVGLSY